MNFVLEDVEKVIVYWDMGYVDYQGSWWIFESMEEDFCIYFDVVDEVFIEFEFMKIYNCDLKFFEEVQYFFQFVME